MMRNNGCGAGPNRQKEDRPTAGQLFWAFFKVGCFTFGGGLAMLPLIRQEVVDQQQWMSNTEIVDAFAIAQSLPGALAINTAIFIGRQLRGLSGALMALAGVVLPAFVSILALLLLITRMQENIYLDKVFSGIKAAAAAMIFLAALQMGRLAAKGRMGFLIALASFLMIVVWNINAAWAIVGGGLAGYLTGLAGERRS